MTTIQPPDFILIPWILLDDENLQPSDHKVYGACYWFENLKDGKCNAGNDAIGYIAKVSPESVTNCLARLEKYGYIKRHFFEKFGEREVECLVKFEKVKGKKSIPSNNGIVPSDDVSSPHQTTEGVPSNNIQKKKIKEEEITKSIHGEFKKVRLTDKEHSLLVEKMGEKNTAILIAELDAYIASKGKKYASHYATILNWARRKIVEHSKIKNNNAF